MALFKHYRDDMMGYVHIQGTRPKTLAYGLTDSPVGQLAWIVEKFKEWTDPAAALPEDAVDRDRLLTNVSLYWFTGTAGSSANLYYEALHDPTGRKRKHRNTVPTGVAVFDPGRRPSGAGPSARTTSCTGPSSSAAATSPRWRSRSSWSPTCASSSAASATEKQ